MSGRGDGTIIAPAPRPRSGLGLNELLARRPAFGVEQNSRVFVLHIAWCRKPQELSPGVGHNPRVMAVAWARAGQRSSCWALCRCCGSAGLTPELSRSALRPRRCDNVPNNSAAAKRSRLERIVRRRLLELTTFDLRANHAGHIARTCDTPRSNPTPRHDLPASASTGD